MPERVWNHPGYSIQFQTLMELTNGFPYSIQIKMKRTFRCMTIAAINEFYKEFMKNTKGTPYGE